MKRDERRLEGFSLAATIVFAALIDAAVIALWIVVPHFKTLLDDFGAEAPRLTQFVLDHYRWSLLLIVGVSLACLGLIRHRGETLEQSRRALVVFSVVCGLCLISIGIFVIAMYMPIFKLGELV